LHPELETDMMDSEMHELEEYLEALKEIDKHQGASEHLLWPYLDSLNIWIVFAAAQAIVITKSEEGDEDDLVRIYNAFLRADPKQIEWNDDLLTEFFLSMCEGRTGAYIVQITKDKHMNAKNKMLKIIRKAREKASINP